MDGGTDEKGELIMANKEAAKSDMRRELERRVGAGEGFGTSYGGPDDISYFYIKDGKHLPDGRKEKRRAIVSKPERDMLLELQEQTEKTKFATEIKGRVTRPNGMQTSIRTNLPENRELDQNDKNLYYQRKACASGHSPELEALKQAYKNLRGMHAVAMSALTQIQFKTSDLHSERAARTALDKINEINGRDV